VNAVVLVPVKAFADAKARLAAVLGDAERERLARWTAARVLAAAGELPTYVACDDEQVAAWAGQHGATVLWHPGVGLNAAVNDSVAELRDAGVTDVVVAHGDLPRAHSLARLTQPGTLTLVPDRHGDGTNVIAVPTDLQFRFAYGPGSFRRHLGSAIAARQSVRVLRDPLLAADIDTPADLAHPLVQEVLPTWLQTNLANHR
jgi:2-phospho-L-lactate guanylyltransferase